MSRKVSAAAFFTVFAMALSACASAASPTPAPLQPVAVKVINLPYAAFAPYWIGMENGYFTDQAVTVEFVDFTSQDDALVAFVGGGADVMAGNISSGMLNAIARGANIKLVSDKGYLDPTGCENQAIVARKGSVTSNNPSGAEIRGKALGWTPGTWLEYWKDKFLASKGLTPNDVEKVNVPVTALLDMMAKGQVDMVGQNEPWTTRLADAGHVAMLPSASTLLPNSQSAAIMFGPKLLSENRDAGRRFMAAYLRAARKYNEGKTDDNVRIISKYTKLDPALLKRMCWPQIRNDGVLNVESVLDFQKWALANGLVDKTLDAAAIHDGSFVEAANKTLGSR